ncbi:polysaccharide pyruvyl transferase family protein [Psychrobacter submarinus]|uniref:polysaccharide pyruvyl transferase family protein n=1 Tax=Psychrobacter submarinus TaxID=154108 RepID=UPI0019195CFB|nr:polysaccharide pyruvyl transferase family protein [Psychrobacter submarinus]
MKYMSYLFGILKKNSYVFSKVKKLTPQKVIDKASVILEEERPIAVYSNNENTFFDRKSKTVKNSLPVFYWDTKPNFGDLIGPYLISKISGRSVVNIKNSNYAGMMAVGSIIQMIDRKNIVIWGSGLINEPNLEVAVSIKKYKPKVLSVRGKKTAKYLAELGITVENENAYGDPALILPLFYEPSVENKEKIGICPHHIHKSAFLEKVIEKNNLKIIDVQEDVETVVDNISSSTVCISTSLHGLIIAQAYEIPWVWLEVCDNNLIGNDFKFKDFFSTIDESQVSHISIKEENIDTLDFEMMAKKAVLPKGYYDKNLILKVIQDYFRDSEKN